MNYEVFKEKFDDLSTSEKLSIYNEYCINYGSNETIEYFDEDFFNCFFSDKMEVARAVYFGNIQSWTDEYIRFNAYGNLESLSEFDVFEDKNRLEYLRGMAKLANDSDMCQSIYSAIMECSNELGVLCDKRRDLENQKKYLGLS